MSVIETYIPSVALLRANAEVASSPYLIILRDPEDGEIDIAVDGLISFYVVRLGEDPATTAPYTITCVVQISLNGGDDWLPAYSTGSFSAPFDGGSSAVDIFDAGSPYVFNKITIDYTSLYDDSSTVMVRVQFASVAGWGHADWGHHPWGHPEGDSLIEEWSFEIEDLTAPKLISAVAIDRKTVRATFDDDMRSTTPDGRARIQTTTTETWDMSAGGETLQVVVDGGETQEITFEVYMWEVPAAATAEEVSAAITALVNGGEAEDDGASGVYLYSQTSGDGSTIQVIGGTANSIFGFPTDQATGTSEGALDVENYTIERNNVYPAVAVHLEVEAVEFVETDSFDEVDLTCQWEMTPGAPYELTVDDDLADTSNNVIDGDYLSAEFTGYDPDWPEDRDAEVRLPQVVWDGDPLEVARALLNMFQEIEDLKITDVDELWDRLFNVDNANMPTIELMLYDIGNPFGTLDLTDTQKKKLVELLPYIYQQKGLPDGLTDTIYTLLGIPLTIETYNQNAWRLGHGVLGLDYPPTLWCSNVEPYNLLGGGTLLVRVDGGDLQTITFDDTDFVDSNNATAAEVATVINDQLDGGAADIFDDGGGVRIQINSMTYGTGSSITVENGTLATELGFDDTGPDWLQSGSGTCILGTSNARSVRTFDLVYSSVVPSAEEVVQIRKIANYMKPVNRHLGNIRAAKELPDTSYWILGFGELGDDTVLGA